ncbi:SNF2 family N-terminal domain-containing protein [Elsinoe ampelina]|uniref:SNF2 family N-terminal domain-containing protein n=1 Tax=Elsinoe ampelina TaxID=302913 RepID=A0A6A6GMZ1_9PEZI|nr:SNF2 family N-terminal domain-containing protein [Elsinoe ampelina]
MSSVTSDMFELNMDTPSNMKVPDLGHSILNKPANKTGNEPLASQEDHLRIMRAAADQLEASGQISNATIKQEPTDDDDDDDVICLGDSIIDLTHFPENKTVIIPDDDDEEIIIVGAKADMLPRAKKRNANEMANSDNEPEQTARKKSKKSKAKGHGNKIDLANAPSVQKLMTTSLFSEIANLDDVPDMPDFDASAIRRGNSEQLFAHLGDQVDQGAATRDARMLNRACNVFGNTNIRRATNGEWQIKGMKSTLKNHQVLGTAFMMLKEKDAREGKTGPQGGILADMMGLGKTVEALASVVRGKARDFDKASAGLGGKTTLVVVTPSLATQWYEEIGVHCNTDDTRRGIGGYMVYRHREWRDRKHPLRDLAKNDIIITTYEEVAKSFPLEEPPEEMTDHDERQKWWDDYFQKHKGHLHRMNFRRVIIDEAHLMRNPDTRKSRAVRVLVGKYRWCLTGTPFTNGVQDIWSLLDFIGTPDLESYDMFKARYLKADEQATTDLNNILGKCMLRRSHGDRLFGARLIALPQASQMQLVCHFNPVEREIYDIIEAAFKRRMQEAMKTHGLMFSRNNSYFAMVTRLRQLTAHPLLIQSTMLDLLERKDLRKLRAAIDEHGVMLQDKKEGKALMTKIKLLLRASYKTKKRTRKNAVDSAAPAPPAAEGTGSIAQEENLGSRYGQRTNFNQLIENLQRDHDIVTRAALGHCEYCKKKATTPQITECCHIYCQQCLVDLQVEAASDGLDRAVCAVGKCKAQYNFVVPFDNEEFSKLVTLKKTVRKTSGGRIKKTDLPAGIVSWMDKGDLVPSAKTKAVKTQIVEWFEQYPSSKIIVYTQWTTMIKILANMCDIEEWKCVRFFGAMTPEARTRAINRFETEDDLKIMICSLQCGGLGLNLTAASKVIVVDAWWNNAVEEQAFARCYRIKQTQETHLLQLSVFNTIDDRIAEVKDRKQLQIDAFSNEKTLRQLSQREIMSLFGEVFEDDDGNMRYFMEGEEDEGESDEEEDRIMEVDEGDAEEVEGAGAQGE